MASLRELLAGPAPVLAPLVLNPLMAKLAEAAGFGALYLGGGATGYERVCLEANLTLTELVAAGIQIRTASPLPLILDAAAGFGDPMHMHRTIAMVEAAGFAAIEIEDQLLPKRAHHHVGIEHMINQDLMAAKILANPRWAVRWTKTATNLVLRDIANRVMDAAIAYEISSNATRDRQEAVRAFVEKRAPVFTGE